MNETEDELKTVAILALQTPVVSVSQEQWQRLVEQLSSRLHHPVHVVESVSDAHGIDGLHSCIESYSTQGFRRFVVLPIGLESFDLRALYEVVAWLRLSNLAVNLCVARCWTTKDWCDAFFPSIIETVSHRSREKTTLLLLAQGDDSNATVGLELASLAYHFQQLTENLDVRYAFVRRQNPSLRDVWKRMDAEGIQNVMLLAWRMKSTQIATALTEIGWQQSDELFADRFGIAWAWNRWAPEPPKSIGVLEHTGWLHVAMGLYFDALATRSIEGYFIHREGDSTENECQLQTGLMELDRNLDALLPPEYQGRTDEVKPQSMGSACIESDRFGAVPWDEIWTSFCDLAMAGGPPHRGKLLEAVTSDEASKNAAAYAAVVQEIRRGIELVTGLKTIRSDALGWVGVVCDDDAMSVWLMRAIIVENIMVRREGAILFLPAGPEFRVRKEIKNVITAVAKTVHYWRAHLRLV